MRAKEVLGNTLRSIFAEMRLETPQKLVIEEPRDARFGDLSTNAALLLAKAANKKPRDLACEIAQKLAAMAPEIASTDVAGPGFINVTFKPEIWRAVIPQITRQGDNYGNSTAGKGLNVLVEYVSANPTGPLHVGHGRGAALGDSVARLLRAAGYNVATEYYLNDAGRQMRTLGLSIWLRVREQSGDSVDFPADCYQGGYIKDLAESLLKEKPDIASLPEAEGVAICQSYGMENILAGIKADLDIFGCGIDDYASEAAMLQSGSVDAALTHLREAGKSYEEDGALWLDTMQNGDDRNRVLRKSDGYLTYFGTDIAYHHDKFIRGHEWLIDVWGADHHGYIPRMRAAIAQMGHNPESFSVLLVQLVNLLRNGLAVSMSTRSGEFITLAEVVDEVGKDAARFMFLSRSNDSPLDFDLELAKQRTFDNPVYYVQYAYARVCSLSRRAGEKGINIENIPPAAVLECLNRPEEIAIMRKLDAFPELVANAARNMAPHQVSKYLLDLAAALHNYYANYQIIVENDLDGSKARLALLRASGQVIKNGLNLLGVSAPESM